MQIDSYGFEATSQFFRRKELDAHLMKRIDGVLYVCFGGESERPIHRLDKDEHGSVRLMGRTESGTRRSRSATSR